MNNHEFVTCTIRKLLLQSDAEKYSDIVLYDNDFITSADWLQFHITIQCGRPFIVSFGGCHAFRVMYMCVQSIYIIL